MMQPKNCNQLPLEVGVKTAKQLLTGRIEDPHIITVSYCQALKQWPQIKTGDSDAYRKFQNFLVKVCVPYFHQIFIFSPNDSPSKTMKNAFCFL